MTGRFLAPLLSRGSWRRHGRALLVAGILAACSVGADPARANGDDLLAMPASARVQLEGPSRVDALGAVDLDELPSGEYVLRLTATGYGAGWARLRLSSGGVEGFRSWFGPAALVLPPGFAHLQRGESRGWIHFAAVSASGGALLATQANLVDARDRISAAQRAIAAGGAEAAAARLDLAAARDEEFDRANMRSLWTAYLASAWVGAGLDAWVFTPQPRVESLPDGGHRLHVSRVGAPRAGISSLLVPGSGQRMLGHSTRANVFSATVLGSWLAAILAQDAYLDARRDRLAAARDARSLPDGLDPVEAARAVEAAQSDENSLSTVRYVAFGLALGLHAWNVIDAILASDSVPHEVEPTSSWVPRVEGTRLAWTFRFD